MRNNACCYGKVWECQGRNTVFSLARTTPNIPLQTTNRKTNPRQARVTKHFLKLKAANFQPLIALWLLHNRFRFTYDTQTDAPTKNVFQPRKESRLKRGV